MKILIFKVFKICFNLVLTTTHHAKVLFRSSINIIYDFTFLNSGGKKLLWRCPTCDVLLALSYNTDHRTLSYIQQ